MPMIHEGCEPASLLFSGGAIEIDYAVTGRHGREMPLSKDILSFK